MMRVCSDLLYDFFTLQRDYNKKKEPLPGKNRFPLGSVK